MNPAQAGSKLSSFYKVLTKYIFFFLSRKSTSYETNGCQSQNTLLPAQKGHWLRIQFDFSWD